MSIGTEDWSGHSDFFYSLRREHDCLEESRSIEQNRYIRPIESAKKALMLHAGNEDPNQTAHSAFWSGPSLPVYRMNELFTIHRQAQKALIHLRECAD